MAGGDDRVGRRSHVVAPGLQRGGYKRCPVSLPRSPRDGSGPDRLSGTPTASPTAGAAYVTPSPTTSLLDSDPSDWVIYSSDRYGFSVGYPAGWTHRPAERDWTYEADTVDPSNPAMEHFVAPDGNVGVSAWSVPLGPDTTSEGWPGFEAWVQAYCEETGNAPCTGIHERAVPLCLKRAEGLPSRPPGAVR